MLEQCHYDSKLFGILRPWTSVCVSKHSINLLNIYRTHCYFLRHFGVLFAMFFLGKNLEKIEKLSEQNCHSLFKSSNKFKFNNFGSIHFVRLCNVTGM